MKPETEIRNLKREMEELRMRMDRVEGAGKIREDIANRAAQEWERRFDVAMDKIPDVGK